MEMTLEELRALLSSRNLPVFGERDELVGRVHRYIPDSHPYAFTGSKLAEAKKGSTNGHPATSSTPLSDDTSASAISGRHHARMNDHGAFARVQKTSVTAHFDNTAEKVQEKYAHELARYEHEDTLELLMGANESYDSSFVNDRTLSEYTERDSDSDDRSIIEQPQLGGRRAYLESDSSDDNAG
ncbi:hypothetical protein AAVH_18192 [Aphelenchoides avenae]|nr:hypothetical protein AAVH_18192 [Aphelenchus avenae]